MMRQQSIAKNPVNYEQQQNETCEFEQKLIKSFNQFSDSEEQEVKEWAEKRLAERREKAGDLKAKRRKKNLKRTK